MGGTTDKIDVEGFLDEAEQLCHRAPLVLRQKFRDESHLLSAQLRWRVPSLRKLEPLPEFARGELAPLPYSPVGRAHHRPDDHRGQAEAAMRKHVCHHSPQRGEPAHECEEGQRGENHPALAGVEPSQVNAARCRPMLETVLAIGFVECCRAFHDSTSEGTEIIPRGSLQAESGNPPLARFGATRRLVLGTLGRRGLRMPDRPAKGSGRRPHGAGERLRPGLCTTAENASERACVVLATAPASRAFWPDRPEIDRCVGGCSGSLRWRCSR